MDVHLSLPSIIALSFFLTILAPSYCNEDEYFKNCSRSSTCGNVTYSFPYWGGGRPKYCGLEEYELECHNNEYPVMSFQAVAGAKALEFRVLRIDSSSGTITVARSDLLADLCAPTLLDTSLNYTLFDYPSNYPSTVQNITVFYGCLSATIQERNRFSCSQDDGHVNGFVEDESLQGYQLPQLRSECPKSIRIPILRNSSLLREPSDVWAALSAAINGGFEVEYNRALAASCTPCVASRGICGSNATGSFVCFCEDQTEAHTCPKRERKGINWTVKIAIGVCASIGSVAIVCIIYLIRKHRYKKKHAPSPFVSRSMSSYPSSVTDSDVGSRYFGVPLFTYAVLERATKNFDSSNELGEGGFGTVYYGKLRDGREVAVKRLYENNCRRMEQFMNEVVILTRLRHQNLVSLYGCTSRHSRELLLVYEYIPNGTVADHIHGEKAKPGGLPWTTRMKIAAETASALTYLHASDVIHRDVKTNNILLDNHFCVKVADFGLSRLFPTDVTHISTAPQGTPGYVDPEYHQCYQLTDKSDVFSFGVVLIELVSSLPAMDITRHRHEINLSNMAINKIQNNALQEFVDPSLGFESDYTIRRMITAVAELAFECLQSAQEMRPSMQEVLKRLEDIRNKDYGKDKAEEIRISADDAVLLGRDSLPLSPDSAPHWTSSSTLSISSS